MSAIKHRHLGRSSSHRQSLLRNLVTSLIAQETISTTFAKAKEAQRVAEKLITLGKKNTGASRHQAEQIFFQPELPDHLPKLFGTLRERYADRPGGYTRVLRQEPRSKDQAPLAILCLVDGPKDVRFHMTARTLVHERSTEVPMRELTAFNVRKVTRFRKDGLGDLEKEVRRLEADREEGEEEDEWEDESEVELVKEKNKAEAGNGREGRVADQKLVGLPRPSATSKRMLREWLKEKRREEHKQQSAEGRRRRRQQKLEEEKAEKVGSE